MISESFPRLRESGYRVTSPATIEYSCIAWAAEDTVSWWWPDRLHQYYWPPGIPRNESVEAFVALFEGFGYEVCEDAEKQAEFEKIAIYVDISDKVTHASRQLESGAWTSKLGRLEDIEHAFDGVSGSQYGSVAVIMRRPKRHSPHSA
ncbi:MAG: hypothetical protein AB1512_24210 [Thermodesulfobacteriota bacterium]